MMSDQQFDLKLRHIEEQYAGLRTGAEAFRDQEVARLFMESGWSQQQIGERMGWSQTKVSRQLMFGRYLRFMPSGHKSGFTPDSLTERRFRKAWSEVGKGHPKETEAERFARASGWLASNCEPAVPKNYINLVKKPGIKPAVAEILKAGTRVDVGTIRDSLRGKFPELDRKQISAAIKGLQQNPPKGYALDARHVGKSHKYRLVPRKGPAPAKVKLEDAGAAACEALPLIEECISILKQPEVGRQTTLALEHLWRVQRALSRLLIPEEVV